MARLIKRKFPQNLKPALIIINRHHDHFYAGSTIIHAIEFASVAYDELISKLVPAVLPPIPYDALPSPPDCLVRNTLEFSVMQVVVIVTPPDVNLPLPIQALLKLSLAPTFWSLIIIFFTSVLIFRSPFNVAVFTILRSWVVIFLPTFKSPVILVNPAMSTLKVDVAAVAPITMFPSEELMISDGDEVDEMLTSPRTLSVLVGLVVLIPTLLSSRTYNMLAPLIVVMFIADDANRVGIRTTSPTS